MLGARLSAAPGRLAVLHPGSWRKSGQTSGQRGYDYRLQKASAAFLKEAEVVLECAAKRVPVPYGNVVDHRIPHDQLQRVG